MAQTQIYTMVLSAVASSPAITLDGAAPNLAVQAPGAFSGTAELQGSVDGDNWTDIQTLTEDMAVAQVAGIFKFIRIDITAYTSGTLTVKVATHRP